MKVIKTIEELKKEARGDGNEFAILLAGGIMRSSKQIQFSNGKFHIFHEVDGEYGSYTVKELAEETNIIEAMKKNCLILY